MQVAEDYLDRGYEVYRLKTGDNSMPDFRIEQETLGIVQTLEVKTMKTLKTKPDTTAKSIREAFREQGADRVTLNLRGKGASERLADEVIRRVRVRNGGMLPGRVDVWLDDKRIIYEG